MKAAHSFVLLVMLMTQSPVVDSKATAARSASRLSARKSNSAPLRWQMWSEARPERNTKKATKTAKGSTSSQSSFWRRSDKTLNQRDEQLQAVQQALPERWMYLSYGLLTAP